MACRLGCEQCFEGVGGGWGAADRPKAVGHSSGTVSPVDGFEDLRFQAGRSEPRRGKPGAGGGHLDAAGDLELIATEWHGADGYAVGECLLGGAHAAVGDGANGAIEERSVWQERQNVRTWGEIEGCRIARGERGDDVEVRIGERVEYALDEAAVVLELR
jgi:hypothetical protein